MKKLVTIAVTAMSLLIHPRLVAVDEITVWSSNGLKTTLTELAPKFEQQTGHRLLLSFGASSLLSKRIEDGQPFDVCIVTPALIDSLTRSGKIDVASSRLIARAGLGVAVRHGDQKPDVTTVDTFVAALLSAKRVAYTTAGQSGLEFLSILERLGIAEQVKAKGVTIASGNAADFLVEGRADVAVQLVSELAAVKGVDVVGPLPAAVQSYVLLTGGIATTSTHNNAAAALLAFLKTPEAAAVMKQKGLEVVQP